MTGFFRDRAGIETFRYDRFPCRLQLKPSGVHVQAVSTDDSSPLDLIQYVTPQSVGSDTHDIGWLPACRCIVENTEFDRQKAGTGGREVDIGVYAPRKRSGDPFRIRAIGQPFPKHITPVEKQSGRFILFEEGTSEDFRKLSQTSSSPQVDLPESVPGCIETLCEECIVVSLGIDMRYTPAIHTDFYRVLQSIHLPNRFFGEGDRAVEQQHEAQTLNR